MSHDDEDNMERNETTRRTFWKNGMPSQNVKDRKSTRL